MRGGHRVAVSRLRLLDLFCGAGGASRGYVEGFTAAGIDVAATGVDIRPQPNYPYTFIQADAMTFPLDGYGFIHASPPCQAFTAYRRTGQVGESPDLIDATRQRLRGTGAPWVMENVEGAPLLDPIMICGSMFDPPMDVRRHRLFESNANISPPIWPCRHKLLAPDRFPGGRSVERTGSSRGLVRATVEVGAWDVPLGVQREAMDIEWMDLHELSEAIPPAYTEHIAAQLAHLFVGTEP